MPDFQYQPPTGPLSGSEFERQTTRFFQQVQGAADAAQSTAIVAQNTANDALERAQASNFVDGKTTTDAGGVITVKDVAIGGDLEDLASARGQIGAARELGNNVDYNTVTKAGFYLINATGGVNGPIVGSAAFLQVFYSKKDAFTKNLYQIVYAYSPARERMFLRQYRLASNDWSSWSEIVSSSCIGDGLTVNNGIISVPEYDGATASAAGTSGLVPPAAAGQHESFLTGGGEYKPALTKISDSVALANSTTAASAKAVKTAYDRGSAGIAAAGEAKGTADRALNAANTAQSSADGALAAANDAQKTANAKVGFYGANSINIGYQNGMAYYNVNETDIKKIAPYETGYATARAAQGNAVYVPSGGTWYFEAIMFRIDDACTVAEQAWFAMNQSFCSVVPGGTKIIDTTATTGCLAFCKKIL